MEVTANRPPMESKPAPALRSSLLPEGPRPAKSVGWRDSPDVAVVGVTAAGDEARSVRLHVETSPRQLVRPRVLAEVQARIAQALRGRCSRETANGIAVFLVARVKSRREPDEIGTDPEVDAAHDIDRGEEGLQIDMSSLGPQELRVLETIPDVLAAVQYGAENRLFESGKSITSAALHERLHAHDPGNVLAPLADVDAVRWTQERDPDTRLAAGLAIVGLQPAVADLVRAVESGDDARVLAAARQLVVQAVRQGRPEALARLMDELLARGPHSMLDALVLSILDLGGDSRSDQERRVALLMAPAARWDSTDCPAGQPFLSRFCASDVAQDFTIDRYDAIYAYVARVLDDPCLDDDLKVRVCQSLHATTRSSTGVAELRSACEIATARRIYWPGAAIAQAIADSALPKAAKQSLYLGQLGLPLAVVAIGFEQEVHLRFAHERALAIRGFYLSLPEDARTRAENEFTHQLHRARMGWTLGPGGEAVGDYTAEWPDEVVELTVRPPDPHGA
jgi:hypothetical protein